MKHFRLSEFECKCGCGLNIISPDLTDRLDFLRGVIGAPITITSGCRCMRHNYAIDGKPASSHLSGHAVDIACTSDETRFSIIRACGQGYKGNPNIFNRIGIGKDFIHLDCDPSKKSNRMWVY